MRRLRILAVAAAAMLAPDAAGAKSGGLFAWLLGDGDRDLKAEEFVALTLGKDTYLCLDENDAGVCSAISYFVMRRPGYVVTESHFMPGDGGKVLATRDMAYFKDDFLCLRKLESPADFKVWVYDSADGTVNFDLDSLPQADAIVKLNIFRNYNSLFEGFDGLSEVCRSYRLVTSDGPERIAVSLHADGVTEDAVGWLRVREDLPATLYPMK